MSVSRDSEPFDVNIGRAALDDVGQKARIAAGHGPAKGAMAGVEIKTVDRCPSDDGGPSGVMGRRPHQNDACLRSHDSGNKVPTECSSATARQAKFVVESGKLGCSAYPDAFAEARDRRLVGFIHNG